MNDFWKNKRVAIMGGASLIGSTLVEQLLNKNPKDLWVIDDLSSGKKKNLLSHVPIMVKDIRNYI